MQASMGQGWSGREEACWWIFPCVCPLTMSYHFRFFSQTHTHSYFTSISKLSNFLESNSDSLQIGEGWSQGSLASPFCCFTPNVAPDFPYSSQMKMLCLVLFYDMRFTKRFLHCILSIPMGLVWWRPLGYGTEFSGDPGFVLHIRLNI